MTYTPIIYKSVAPEGVMFHIFYAPDQPSIGVWEDGEVVLWGHDCRDACEKLDYMWERVYG